MSTTRLRKKVRDKAELLFPEDIIINILSRLPAKSVLRCRLVCRVWSDLTSTLDFIQLHIRRRTPMILVEYPTQYPFERNLNHILWEPERKRVVYHELKFDMNDEYKVKFSHGGLIVFGHSYCARLVILNPTSNQSVTIDLWGGLGGSEIYGVFFHPLLEEYCTLWRLSLGGEAYYKILNLGPKPCWREISNPWNHKVTSTDSRQGRVPVLIGECLYWLVLPKHEDGAKTRRDIMKYDIRSEKFALIHCPVPSDFKGALSESNLLDIDGIISFVLTSYKKNQVTVSIWKLKDGATQVWLPMYYSFREDCMTVSRAIPVAGEKLVLLSNGRLHVRNLKIGTTSVKKKFNNVSVSFPHVMSLASLRNCKSRISMDNEGEIPDKSYMGYSLIPLRLTQVH